MVSCFISADWGKDTRKRSVYIADRGGQCIRRPKPPDAGWNLDALLSLAKSLLRNGPVLIGIDVVLGIPEGYWRLVLDEYNRYPPKTFVDWLGGLDPSGEFFETVYEPDEWHVSRPWFNVPKGKGSLGSFTDKVGDGMRRRIDKETGGNPVFAVSGIPGTVGSGTREFWKELIPYLSDDREFAVWPFEGDLPSLHTSYGIVLCETYPALAYAAALAENLPTARIGNSKTKREWRHDMCDGLVQAEWVRANRVELGCLNPVRENEDDFDAYFTVAAVLRCLHEGRQLAGQDWIDKKVEGSMLLAGIVEPRR